MSDFMAGDLPSQDGPLMTFESACVGWDTYEPEQGVESYWMEGDSLAPPCQSDLEVVRGVLEFANINKQSVIYDLGCGDGRICVLASKMYGCKSCGAEIEERLLTKFQGNVDREKLNDSVAIYAGDLRTMNFAPATHLIIYLLPEAIDQITPMLVDAINNGCTVICIGWQAKAFTPSACVQVGTYQVDLYKYDMNSIPNVASLMERKGSVPMDMEAMERMDESEQMCLALLCADESSFVFPRSCHKHNLDQSKYDCDSSECMATLRYFKQAYSEKWALRHESMIKSMKANKCTSIVEIGIARGSLSYAILNATTSAHNHYRTSQASGSGIIPPSSEDGIAREYHAVDPFLGHYDDKNDQMSLEFEKMNKIGNANKTSMVWASAILHKMFPFHCRFRLHHGMSHDMVHHFNNESIKCIFLDGNHAYAAVKQDIHDWMPKLQRGGYFYFDDYGAMFMGTVKAIDELTDRNSLTLQTANMLGNVYVQKPSDGTELDTMYVYPDNKGYESAY